MSFAVHTFETNSSGSDISFAFHEILGEGQELFFLAKFEETTRDAKVMAEAIFGCVVENFKSPSMKDPYDIFEEGLKSANKEIQKRSSQFSKIPEIVMALFDFHNLYLSQIGEAEVYLIRGTNLSQITESSDQNDGQFSNILSGQVAVNDTLIMASSRLLRILTTNQLIDIFDRNNFADAVSLLKHELTVGSEESILSTIIGISKKKEATRSAGFLSRGIAEGKKSIANISEKITNLKKKESSFHSEKETEVSPGEEKEIKAEPPREHSTQKTKKKKREISSWDTKKIIEIVKKLPDIKNFKKNDPQKNLILTSAIVLIMLVGYIVIKFAFSLEFGEPKEMRERIALAQDSIRQAEQMLFQGEKKAATEILNKGEEALKIVLNEGNKELRNEARFLMVDLQTKKLEAENAKQVTAQMVADLGVKLDNFEATELNELNGNLFVSDRKQVVKTIRNIIEKEVSITTKETIIASDIRKDQNTILFLTDTPQIIEFREGTVTPMSTEDQTWKKGIDIKTYGQFAYILDPIENQIWKYKRDRSKYSVASPYNLGTVNLSRAISMAIDGRIYVLSDDGTIQKFFRGSPEKYEFKDIPSIPFSGKNLRLITMPEHEFLYVLDPDNSRVLLFSKGENFATYKKQIIFELPQGETAKDFTVNDTGQKINIATQNKIYEFSL